MTNEYKITWILYVFYGFERTLNIILSRNGCYD